MAGIEPICTFCELEVNARDPGVAGSTTAITTLLPRVGFPSPAASVIVQVPGEAFAAKVIELIEGVALASAKLIGPLEAAQAPEVL
jgi:hypothetical protein